jgi:hypothetical protein
VKKTAIMQPYFFPYVGYFSLIKHTDQFILFDPVQFIRHGWIERNRVLKQNDGWLYIKVPLQKHSQETLIKDIRIDNSQPWRETIFAQLQPYKKIAPYYTSVIALVHDVLDNNYDDIVTLNKAALEKTCAYLGMDKHFEVFSQMNLEIEKPNGPDEWALNIRKALGDVDEYWNPPGGMEFFDREKYATAGVDIKFQKVKLEGYDQKRPFESGLSIIDVLMFNSPEKVNEMLDNYELQ